MDSVNQRMLYLDFLRVFAIFFVIVIHVSSSGWLWGDNTISEIANWKIYSFYQSISIWAVPVFVMISGGLMLRSEGSNNVSLRNQYIKIIKKIIRLSSSLLFWLCIYEISVSLFINHNLEFSLYRIFKEFIFGNSGYGHFWFVYMIIGLYILAPLLKSIIPSLGKKGLETMILTIIIFGYLIPTLNLFFKISETDYIIQFTVPATFGFLGYFILGHYLLTYNINRILKNTIHIFSIFSFVISVALTWYFSLKMNKPNIQFLESYLPFALICSLSVFLLFKDIFTAKIPILIKNISKTVSNSCYGIYLIHILVLTFLTKLGFFISNPVYAIPVLSFLIFLISFIIVFLLSKIPIVSKYII